MLLNLALDIINKVRRLNIQCPELSAYCPDEDLHVLDVRLAGMSVLLCSLSSHRIEHSRILIRRRADDRGIIARATHVDSQKPDFE